MTSSDQENIERKLNHVLEMGKRIIELYPHITCTERAALLLAMVAAVRQVSANIRNVAALLRKNLLDTFRIDYCDYARKVEYLYNIWEELLKGAPIVHNLDNRNLPITNPGDIVLKEDTDYDLNVNTMDKARFDLLEARIGLMENAPLMCDAIGTGLVQISKTLRDITADYLRLKADSQRQDERLKELERLYEEAMWESDLERLEQEVKMFVTLRNNHHDKETFLLFQQRMEWEATDPHDKKMLARLNEWFLAGKRPAAFIVENRDKLTLDDLAGHFRFVRCRHLVARKVESFDLLLPADAEYKDLFVNQAAQELAFQLAVTIGNSVDFRHNYQYAALQMAMQDLGLIFSGRNNGGQMRDYVNKAYLRGDEQIKDQSTLTQWTGKLLGATFGKMDERHLLGNYAQKDFERMKDYYWQCLSIINKVLERDLRQQQFASYLFQEHERTPSINDYRNSKGQSIMERLSVLKSVIRGETPFQ